MLPAPPTRRITMSQPPEGVGVALKEGVTLALPESVPERETTERVEVVEGLAVTVSERAAEGDATLRVAEAHLEAEREAGALRETAGEAVENGEVDKVRLARGEGVPVTHAVPRGVAVASAEREGDGDAEGDSDAEGDPVSTGDHVSDGLPLSEGDGDTDGDTEALPVESGERVGKDVTVGVVVPAGRPALRWLAVAVAKAVADARTRSEGEGEGDPVTPTVPLKAAEGEG